MFDREHYLESILKKTVGKADGENCGSTLADVVLYAELTQGDRPQEKRTVEVIDNLRANAAEHVLLLGKPGSGKSTALKYLLREEAEKCLHNASQLIPVLLELRRLDKNTTIEDLLAKALSVPRYRVKPDNIADLLDEYHFLLLLDGLNELYHRQLKIRFSYFDDSKIIGHQAA
jgi:predicted NACHT family NTPase